MLYFFAALFLTAQLVQGFLVYCLVLERTASQSAIQAASTRNRILCAGLISTLAILSKHYPLRNDKADLEALLDSISKLHVQP